MKGRIVLLDRIDGRLAAALIVDGRLEDLLIEPADKNSPRPGAIYAAIADRPVKGQNGIMLRLGGGQTGFLRQGRGVSPGQKLLVQISTRAESGKAAPVSTRLLFKGRYGIITPGAKGLNIARSIRNEAERARLSELAHAAMTDQGDNLGLILRSACAGTDEAAIFDEISSLLDTCHGVLGEQDDAPALLLAAPSVDYLAWRDWVDPDQVFDTAGSFADHGVLEMIDAVSRPDVPLGHNGSLYIEPTHALVAVDVNTGGDFSHAAGLKANLATARELPRQLRLRGLGGQIVIDFAPMAKKDRQTVEQALIRTLKGDRVDTILVGWTPLGHLELQRKRERLPLDTLL